MFHLQDERIVNGSKDRFLLPGETSTSEFRTATRDTPANPVRSGGWHLEGPAGILCPFHA